MAHFDIESAWLNADQEQKVENVLNLGKELGIYKEYNQEVPATFRSMRMLFETRVVRDGLQDFVDYIKKGGGLDAIENAIKQFDEVYAHELNQVRTGTQKFVPENQEANQV